MKTRKPLVIGMVVGALMTGAPVLGALGTFFGMMHAFDVLGQKGISDPNQLSGSINEALFATVAGVSLAIGGLVLFTVCLIVFLIRGKRPPADPISPEPH